MIIDICPLNHSIYDNLSFWGFFEQESPCSNYRLGFHVHDDVAVLSNESIPIWFGATAMTGSDKAHGFECVLVLREQLEQVKRCLVK